ncbi:MAG: superoxide dismutase [Verrucomicrobia bacterium]|nr:superoxide dismutase [Verrucomicrobiota bacterium]MBV9129563.1 superoxide dismutase [Verrucomicrobiota bacterium]MBV9298602.1 superoxide dismutase [Verrucomicrobiota bacterium]MBV9643991.1 superoxide dismutase [Verrucomicrobiota bacterium]
MMTRREAIKAVALTAGALAVTPSFLKGATADSSASNAVYPFKVPELGYPYDALEPYIDAQTMQIHHDKHNAAYVENLNKALAQAPESIQKKSLEDLLLNLDKIPENIRTAVRNNGGGQYNHAFFWKILKKNDAGQPIGDLSKSIDATFGGYPAFQAKFSEAAMKVFGSGWAWLVADGKNLAITTRPNQDCPISKPDGKEIPIVGIDVWEHAYYLKYQNRRAEYVKAFWNLVNWDYAAEQYAAASKQA